VRQTAEAANASMAWDQVRVSFLSVVDICRDKFSYAAAAGVLQEGD
jgi:hypothetical protein